MKDNVEQNYKKLLSLGFKKVWFQDKSGYWMEKRIDINEFKGKLYYDGRFSLMEIEVILDVTTKKKTLDTIWIGSFKQLLLKAKKYVPTKK